MADSFLLLGPENGEKETFVSSIRKNIAQKTGSLPEEYKFYPFETTMAEVIALLRNGSLFSPHKLVIFGNAEEIKRKDDTTLLAEYLSNPSGEATLIFLSDETKIDQKLSKLFPKERTKIFWELFENQKRGWIINFFRKGGISIDEEAVELTLSLIQNSTLEMKKECEKLMLFFNEGSRITTDEIEEYLYHSKEENVFSLFDVIARGDFEGALEILQKIQLSADAQPVQLLAGLLWQFRRLLTYRTLLDKGVPSDEAHRSAAIKGKRNQRLYTEAARVYTARDLRRIIMLTARYDGLLRTGGTAAHGILLQTFLYYCVQRKGVEAIG